VAESGLPPRRPYAFTRFYVMTVTTGPLRIASMRAHVAHFPSHRRAFLFADIETLRAHDGDLLALPWLDGEGSTVRLGASPGVQAIGTDTKGRFGSVERA